MPATGDKLAFFIEHWDAMDAIRDLCNGIDGAVATLLGTCARKCMEQLKLNKVCGVGKATRSDAIARNWDVEWDIWSRATRAKKAQLRGGISFTKTDCGKAVVVCYLGLPNATKVAAQEVFGEVISPKWQVDPKKLEEEYPVAAWDCYASLGEVPIMSRKSTGYIRIADDRIADDCAKKFNKLCCDDIKILHGCAVAHEQ